ncbi:Uncharacterized protein TPAR_08530, partial [Tolypocladium paradoxum]
GSFTFPCHLAVATNWALAPVSPPTHSTSPRCQALGYEPCFHDHRDQSTVLGGLVLTRGITNSNFYFMLDILLVIERNFSLRDDHGGTVPRDSQPLHPGNYAIVTDGTLALIDEAPLLRTTTSRTPGTRTKVFTEQVRQRDQRCVITKTENPDARFGIWTSFEAAHIFPLAFEGYWIAQNFARWITLPPTRGGTINSVQNGLLLRSDMHQRFNTYSISINPNDNYKVVCFQSDIVGVAGTFLDRRLLDDERRPVDELLRWHFRQAILTNMRGAGEPIFEHDFPPRLRRYGGY